jgi:hypothetical protein
LAIGIIVPASVDSTPGNGSTGDYFWSAAINDDRIWQNGGRWADGSDAGLFDADVTHHPSYTSVSLGTRLAKV